MTNYQSNLKLLPQKMGIQWNIEDFNIHCAIAKAHYGESETQDLEFGISLNQDPYSSNDGPIVRNKWKYFLKKPCEGAVFLVGLSREVCEYGEKLPSEIPFGIKLEISIDHYEEGRVTRIFALQETNVFQMKHGASREWEVPQLNTTTDVAEVGYLSLDIQMEIVPGLWVAQAAESKEEEAKNNQSILQVCNDIGTLLSICDEQSDAQQFLDFTIKSMNSKGDEKSFKVHKCVIAARSPVFKRMLENSHFNEAKEATVTITDVSSEALAHFLKFLYTAELNVDEDCWYDNGKIIMELVYAADKYQVHSLTSVCDKHLPEFLSPENAYDMFDLCIKHNLEASTPIVEKYMEDNILLILQEKRKSIQQNKKN